MKVRPAWFFVLLAMFLFTIGGCGSSPTPVAPEHEHEHDADEMPALSPATLATEEKLRAVATTSMVADVVQEIGGDRIELAPLLPRGADPHAFEPTPRDIAAVANAHVVFVNGVGLEAFLASLLESAEGEAKVVPVSYGVELHHAECEHEGEQENKHESDHEGGYEGEHECVHEGGHEGEGYDPHVWFDPNNVVVWVHNIEHALSTLDPDNASIYQANAEAYEEALHELDQWIEEQVAQVPLANRNLVTDHTTFTYFAHRYGFEQVGAIFPGYSTLAEPSAQELAALEATILQFDVKAVFVGQTVSPELAEQVAEDTAVQMIFLYVGSLSEAGGPADTYLTFMQYNVTAIVDALR